MLRHLLSRHRNILGPRRAGATATRRASGRRALPALESLEGRKLLTLTPIAQNSGFPYSTIVELAITYPDKYKAVGSGVLVDSYHVLTAGHVVYSSAHGGFASTIVVTPEQYGNSAPFGTATMTHETTYNAFINYDKAHPGKTAPGDMDIALFSVNRNIGNSTGWMSYGYDNNNNDFGAGAILNTAGFPAAGGYDGHHEEFSSGGIAGLSSDKSAIQYYQSSITTYGGQSGSPVWRYTPSTGARVVYGIHVGGDGTASSLNFATRITQTIFTDLGNWIAQDNGVRRPTSNVVAVAATPTTQANTEVALVPLATAPVEVPITYGAIVPTARPAKAAAFRLTA